MKRFFLVLFSMVAVAGWTGCGAVEETSPAEQITSVAGPNWSLPRLDGSLINSEDLLGKVVVVDFWATWCPPCRAEIPGYIAMQRELADEDLIIVGVSLDEGGPAVVQKFADQMGINYELVMGDLEVVRAFGGVQVIPTTFLIDREGRVRHRKEGMMSRKDYEAIVREVL
ncbi:TlpA family protein disulfide reductase [Opitutaceae bacterium]|nr:TlpA family protein disulfide reductase [Opitutaceae bacterium]